VILNGNNTAYTKAHKNRTLSCPGGGCHLLGVFVEAPHKNAQSPTILLSALHKLLIDLFAQFAITCQLAIAKGDGVLTEQSLKVPFTVLCQYDRKSSKLQRRHQVNDILPRDKKEFCFYAPSCTLYYSHSESLDEV
jgi:hypothetical protein